MVLLSDTTFSCVNCSSGVIDIDVEQDQYGLPFWGGKSLHGLLLDNWLSMSKHFPGLGNSAKRIFGFTGDLAETSILRIGDHLLEDPVRRLARKAVESKRLTPAEILDSLTDIRYQTSEEQSTGAPATHTLRSTRVILRGLRFESRLTWLSKPEQNDVICLALSVLAARHAGLSRNRGRGWVRLSLDHDLMWTQSLVKGVCD